jgi:hypothetical protein
MNLVSDLLRQRFGLLKVVRRAPSDTRYGNAIWLCRCCCGREVPVRGDHLVQGRRKTCGFSGCSPSLHSIATKEYALWAAAKRRCFSKKDSNYSYYGGRGISMCARWKNSFENFISDMRPRPSSKHTLDRIDNNGNYEPTNCRWATRKEQLRNTRVTIFVEHEGKRIALADLVQQVGVSMAMVRYRIQHGWELDDALLIPPGKKGKAK